MNDDYSHCTATIIGHPVLAGTRLFVFIISARFQATYAAFLLSIHVSVSAKGYFELFDDIQCIYAYALV